MKTKVVKIVADGVEYSDPEQLRGKWFKNVWIEEDEVVDEF